MACVKFPDGSAYKVRLKPSYSSSAQQWDARIDWGIMITKVCTYVSRRYHNDDKTKPIAFSTFCTKPYATSQTIL